MSLFRFLSPALKKEIRKTVELIGQFVELTGQFVELIG
jgi:hypothetical protein